jgi:hypothetical protein
MPLMNSDFLQFGHLIRNEPIPPIKTHNIASGKTIQWVVQSVGMPIADMPKGMIHMIRNMAVRTPNMKRLPRA